MGKHDLLKTIDAKLAAAREAKAAKSKRKRTKAKPSTRAAVNKANAKHSTGPKTPAGKAAASTNSTKQGFFANVQKLVPTDAPNYTNHLADLRQSLKPDGPAEDLLTRDLAMLRARLDRLESIEFALLMDNIEGEPAKAEELFVHDEFNEGQPLDYAYDPRHLAQSFLGNADALDRLSRIETHLRRAYNRTWDRLDRIQRDRKKPTNRPNWTADNPKSPKRTHPNPNPSSQTKNRPNVDPINDPTDDPNFDPQVDSEAFLYPPATDNDNEPQIRHYPRRPKPGDTD